MTQPPATTPNIHVLPDRELVRLAGAIAREDFADPVSRGALVLAKFGHLEAELDALVGHSKRAALAIIRAILGERKQVSAARAQAVWAGPAPTGQGTREPYDLLVELIATAEHSVLFTGVDLEREARLLKSLHAAQRGRDLQVTLVLAEGATDPARTAAELFGHRKPWPALFTPDPTRARGAIPFSLLTDDARGVVITGAMPDVEAPDHALTAGLLIENTGVVLALRAQWQLLIDAGALQPMSEESSQQS
jgi:hypothetical protein